MGIYSTFFLSSPGELAEGFPGWKLPLPLPVRREYLHPFTKKLVQVETREPDWPEQDVDPVDAKVGYIATVIKGSFEQYLENRLPPFVRARPHWATKGLTEVELGPLCALFHLEPKFEQPIYGPPSQGAVILSMPRGITESLSTCDVGLSAGLWAAAMSTRGHTHSVSGRRLNDGWTSEQAIGLLNPLVALARRDYERHELYLLIEA